MTKTPEIENPDPLGMLKHSGGYQPLKTFIARNVQPQAVSTIQLSGGKSKPHYFSLAASSTVPFAVVEGAGGIQKEFSWGETIEIPPGMSVNVANSSRHAGDIIIQSGTDRSNTPARISIPIQFDVFGTAGSTTTYAQNGFIDTRRARRCYWVAQPYQVPPANFRVITLGYYWEHSANPEGNNVFDTASWYSDMAAFTPGDKISYVPIGLGVDYNTFTTQNMVPMVLADYQRVLFEWPEGDEPPIYNFAVLEYL